MPCCDTISLGVSLARMALSAHCLDSGLLLVFFTNKSNWGWGEMREKGRTKEKKIHRKFD